MTITYSTRDIAPNERATYWREVVIKDLARHSFRSSVGRNFRASLRMDTLGGLGVSTFDCDACEVARDRADIAQCRNDDYFVGLQLAGTLVMTQGERTSVVQGGSFGLWDTQQPGEMSLPTTTRCVMISVPRHALDARLGKPNLLTARTMESSKPLNGLTAGFLGMLATRTETLHGPTASLIADQALDLLALAFSTEHGERVRALSSPREISLLRLKSVIEGRLSDPELKPAVAAAAAGLSFRYANQLLASAETSLERYIMDQRLDRCRRAFDDPGQARRSIGDIAYSWGFSDLSHFSRRFKAKFGSSPSDYRRNKS